MDPHRVQPVEATATARSIGRQQFRTEPNQKPQLHPKRLAKRSMLRGLTIKVSKQAIITNTGGVLQWNSLLQELSATGDHHAVLALFRHMLDSGARPDASSFPSLLHSCARLSTAPLGCACHALAGKSGCLADLFVASSLVHMYVTCGNIVDAHKVVDGIPHRNVVSWSTLVQGYARMERVADALTLFKRMQSEDGVRPNDVSIISLLPACRWLGLGESAHACVVKLGFESHSLVGTSLADMYLKCRNVDGAIRVFNGLEDKNVVSWLVMVSGLAKNNHLEGSVSVVLRMLWFGLIPDSISLVDLLSSCAQCGNIQCGMWVHSLLVKSGATCDEYVASVLISMYSSCGLLDIALIVFDHVCRRNLVVWNSILHSCAREGCVEDSILLFRQLKHSGLSPDFITIRSLLSLASFSEVDNWFGKSVHCYAIKDCLDMEIDTMNSLVDFYAKAGDLQDAECLFSILKGQKDPVSWNCMIRGYLQNGHPERAVRIFQEMHSECVAPDSVTLSSILKVFASTGDVLNGLSIHALATKVLLSQDDFVGTALVDMYAKCGDISSAYRAFSRMPYRDISAWNAMISGYCQHGFAGEAFALFNRMNADAFSSPLPDFITVASVVSAVGHSGSLELGKQLHTCAVKQAFLENVTVGNAIITMYSKCGLVGNACSFFRRMLRKDSTSWTAMIAGYGMNGFGQDAIALFEEMKQQTDVIPNDITFLEVLSACSHAGLLQEGFSYFKAMKSLYKISPSTRHYACIVDLLGRKGHTYEAYLLMRSMVAVDRVQPDAAVWGALLSACRIHGDVELGEVAAEEIMRLDPRDSGYQLLLSNLYAATGRWNDVAGVRCGVEDGRLMRTPGWSCIEIRN